MKACHPETGEWFYFIDKCLPFGSSISCTIFQDISDAIAFIVMKKSGKSNINYLDDFLFISWLKKFCNDQVKLFLTVCEEIDFPVAMEKTCWATHILIFLGLLIDTRRQVVCIPLKKLDKAMQLVNWFLGKKKASLKQFQQLCRSLNFLCKCVILGRTFLRRLYPAQVQGLKPHHHLKITHENKLHL